MTLVEVFLGHLSEARHARFAACAGLEGALAELVAKGRAAWVEIPLREDDFVAFLARTVPEDAADELAALRGDDLWLAFAYACGTPGAAAAIERRCFARIAVALSRLGGEAALIADVLQEMRARLVEMQAPGSDKRFYSGRGSLESWLRVSAVREMNLRRNRRARELPAGTEPAWVISPEHEPEMTLLLKTYKRELNDAFKKALASMSGRERNVLRYHFVEGLSIDRIAALYGVHRATAARWIGRASEKLSGRTRALFCGRVSLSGEGFQRIVGLIESQIRVHLAAA